MSAELLAAAERLVDALERENAALATLDLPSAAAMFEDKQRAAAGFIAVRTGSIGFGQRAAVERSLGRLQLLAEQNRTLLERAIAAQRRVIGIIARAVPQATATPRYAAGGSLADAPRPAAFALLTRV